MSRNLLLLGAGGSVADVLDILDALAERGERWNLIGLLDDGEPPGALVHGVPVLGPLASAGAHDAMLLNVIGSDRSYRRRPAIVASTGAPRERFATLVHPGSLVSPRARLGHGIYVAAGALLGGGVEVEDHATLHPGCIVGHDSHVGAHAIVAPGAVVAGRVRLGRACYVGSGATVRSGLEVGDGALVGMGAVVTREVPPGEVVVGNPARPLRQGQPE